MPGPTGERALAVGAAGVALGEHLPVGVEHDQRRTRHAAARDEAVDELLGGGGHGPGR